MIQSNLIPMVIDDTGAGERAFDIYSLLLKERIIFLNGPIDSKLAGVVIAQLLYLNSVNGKRPINLYIQSPGGEVYSGLAIYDTMKMVTAPVSTYSIGFTGSMGTFLLNAGSKGNRYALSHSTIHMHPTGGGSKGYTEDVRIATREQERLQTQIFHIMGKNSNKTWKEIEAFFLRDRYLNSIEAKDYGIVDEVLGDTNNLIALNREDFKVSFLTDNSII
ncbi:ClpP family protease [Galbibacter sp. EGI 63066]|uniref:ClpP family protease n=1 Tax=Galbibacter sp. EGI 63066 TaxID=2993559 RepID=UPI002248CB92|nr:ATP-dependent Clp protease proteolytic subunit [Galbibacter sp. EGI 63066]